MAQTTESRRGELRAFIKSVHGIRYHVRDVDRAVAFYTQQLGFTLEHQALPAFASLSLSDVRILLSGPGASGSRPMPNGEPQEPGGWNRIVLKVSDLPRLIAELKQGGLQLRNEMETVRVVDKFNLRILTEIPSSSSSRLAERRQRKAACEISKPRRFESQGCQVLKSQMQAYLFLVPALTSMNAGPTAAAPN